MSNDNNNDKLPEYISYGTPTKAVIKFFVSGTMVFYPPVSWILEASPKGDLMMFIIPLTARLIYKILPFNNDYYLIEETYECIGCHKKVTVIRGKSPGSVISDSCYDDSKLHDFKITDTNYIKLVKVDSKENAICSFKGRYWRIKG